MDVVHAAYIYNISQEHQIRHTVNLDLISRSKSHLTSISTPSNPFPKYMFYHKDPRRLQPLVDFLLDAFTNLDFNAELSFDAVKVIALYRAFFEELGRKFMPWVDDTVERSWSEIHGEHDDVRNPNLPRLLSQYLTKYNRFEHL